MTKIFLINFILCFSFVGDVFCHDTAKIPFNGRNVVLFDRCQRVKWLSQDGSANDTVISIGRSKFLYFKRSDEDSLVIEGGQLGLYRVANKLYLLREGMWILEETNKKILFHNSGNDEPLIEEIPTDPSPVSYSNAKKQKMSKKKRVLKIVTSNNPE